ncbi:alkaline phosphatase family protein [Chengkuizengella axinellae]|uniref:Ectonucleotide pyrophosphatase/phosphodiesterase n=1 Tax=Chengkuizengella axinellae TaxID=3064388 RepID=A0ABT9J192_9BACL|nr:ectonucleotide pyrophosphatase/phosphodiesterase [Chengkuizengella sp. 2205SS18-9]MDP5275345.1 ectonucleotide pyrophosphatase/phosphodiesterase [Chengkuizengella sp. 2205SS18-9]
MKKASWFEIIAARCWNLLNEGKPFTPIFVVGVFYLYHFGYWTEPSFWLNSGLSLCITFPLFILYYHYDFPLYLRNYLWLPLIAYLILFNEVNLPLVLLAVGLYFFFTVFFWGTFYYHLRIGTSWLNFTRFWKLVLKNSDSTSGNAQEQLPKFILLLWIWQYVYEHMNVQGTGLNELPWITLLSFAVAVFIFSWVLHRYIFDWKPKEDEGFTKEKSSNPTGKSINDKVIVIVIDGMRKDKFKEANTPFLDDMRLKGTEYTQMETVYPARTVVCFSSMFTGTYPREHGITSNMVWKLGIKVESIFDSLRKVGKKGRLLGIAHLIDSFGKDVESVTAVMNNDVADLNIMNRAKQIMSEQDPDFLVVQFIGTDQTGHSRGVHYDDYIQKIEEVDSLIEQFVTWLDEQGKKENTTFIVCADHGQADGIGGHGHLDEGERYVPFFIHGPSIHGGKRVEEKHSLISIAPTVSTLLGAPYPSHSRGKVLSDALNLKGEENKS